MKTLEECLLLFIVFTMGCSLNYTSTPKKHQSKEDFLNYLMNGYDKNISNLYQDDWNGKLSRLKDLHCGLGLKDVSTFYTMNKGQWLVFEKLGKLEPNESGILILSTDAPPKIIKSREELPNPSERISSLFDSHKHGFPFSNSYLNKAGIDAIWADDHRFLCYGEESQFYDNNGDEKFIPVDIVSINKPKKKTLSRLKKLPRSIIVTDNKLYLATQTYSKELPVIHFEVFDIIGEDELRYVKDYYFDPPWASTVTLCVFSNFDYQTNSQLINVWRRWPYPIPTVRYLYNYDDNSLEKAPDGTVEFIDPDILKNSVQYVDLEKVEN